MFSKSYLILFTFIQWIYAQENPRVNLFTAQSKPVIGSKSSFTCQASAGSLPLNILWYKDNKEISDSSTIRIRTIEDFSNLIIESVSPSHSGNYTCKISNQFGSDISSLELKVEGPPSWNEKPENLRIRLGKSSVIKCSASSYPKSTIEWKISKGSSWTSLDSSDLFKRIDDNQLSIVNASPKHSGKYGCLVSNSIEPNLWSEFNIAIDAFQMDKKVQK
ncbi:cell adhesion molecule DSCAM-like isoform X2 [Panonychus citri]|uniref:cell adhesion molecule DSCAM-like isoform X2 n=1 Tax=Panonychus citri TaxID=50023 RepID=UPI002306F2DD|nr:cell adhesion molecule DSCAM-like isoform X2 [Panonychus citri]